jgi:hypothetical protein
MSTTPTAAMKTLLGLPPLQLVVEKRPGRQHSECTAPTILKNQTIFKMATEDFLLALSDSMLPMEEFDRIYLVKYL